MKVDLKDFIKNAIVLKPCDTKMSAPKCASKIGGKPDLPYNFEWYTYKDSDGKVYPLSFMAQINLEEVHLLDKDKLLPDKGMLYFFYELETMNIGCSPKEKGSAKVFYYEGDIDSLVPADFPDDLDEDYRLPEFVIKMDGRQELPFCEEYNELTGMHADYEEYNRLKAQEMMLYPDEEIHKLLGYADLVQGSMLVACEMLDNGIYIGDFGHLKVKPKYMDKASEWQLLLQMDTVSNDDYELMFGDCGRIYFYIKKEDLRRRNFDNIWLISQCC